MAKYLCALLLITIITLFSSELPSQQPPSETAQMFDSNETFSSSVREFDRELWEREHAVGIMSAQTLHIELYENVYLKTMVIVNVNSEGQPLNNLGVEKVFFGIEIRFHGL